MSESTPDSTPDPISEGIQRTTIAFQDQIKTLNDAIRAFALSKMAPYKPTDTVQAISNNPHGIASIQNCSYSARSDTDALDNDLGFRMMASTLMSPSADICGDNDIYFNSEYERNTACKLQDCLIQLITRRLRTVNETVIVEKLHNVTTLLRVYNKFRLHVVRSMLSNVSVVQRLRSPEAIREGYGVCMTDKEILTGVLPSERSVEAIIHKIGALADMLLERWVPRKCGLLHDKGETLSFNAATERPLERKKQVDWTRWGRELWWKAKLEAPYADIVPSGGPGWLAGVHKQLNDLLPNGFLGPYDAKWNEPVPSKSGYAAGVSAADATMMPMSNRMRKRWDSFEFSLRPVGGYPHSGHVYHLQMQWASASAESRNASAESRNVPYPTSASHKGPTRTALPTKEENHMDDSEDSRLDNNRNSKPDSDDEEGEMVSIDLDDSPSDWVMLDNDDEAGDFVNVDVDSNKKGEAAEIAAKADRIEKAEAADRNKKAQAAYIAAQAEKVDVQTAREATKPHMADYPREATRVRMTMYPKSFTRDIDLDIPNGTTLSLSTSNPGEYPLPSLGLMQLQHSVHHILAVLLQPFILSDIFTGPIDLKSDSFENGELKHKLDGGLPHIFNVLVNKAVESQLMKPEEGEWWKQLCSHDLFAEFDRAKRRRQTKK